jgi:L-rhamnose mutarotase
MNNDQSYCLALDLKDDPNLISEYEAHHNAVWPEILESLKDSGISSMEIFRAGNRLFMIMKVSTAFSFERKNSSDQSNQKVQEWEKRMWTYQQALPFAKPGEKWVVMKKIFDFKE